MAFKASAAAADLTRVRRRIPEDTSRSRSPPYLGTMLPATRRDFLATMAALPLVPRLRGIHQPRPRPSPAQLAWQRDELAIFVHFGINTFTDREWGDGREDPALFNPDSLDCRQWARTARA